MRVVGTVLALVVSFALLNARLVSAADGLRTLVIYDSESIKQSHSQYSAALKGSPCLFRLAVPAVYPEALSGKIVCCRAGVYPHIQSRVEL